MDRLLAEPWGSTGKVAVKMDLIAPLPDASDRPAADPGHSWLPNPAPLWRPHPAKPPAKPAITEPIQRATEAVDKVNQLELERGKKSMGEFAPGTNP
jgi:hypothetical protein